MNKKLIEVDYNSLEDLQKWIGNLKSRFSQLKSISDPNFVSKSERIRRTYNACMNILETDISVLYRNLDLDMEPKYYVYAHCDTGFKIALKKDGKTTFAASLGMEYVPFYIGKGTGERAYDLNRNESHRKIRQKLRSFNHEIDVKILKDGLTELEALCLESKLIDIFGLISQRNGHLVNLDEGISPKERKSLYSVDYAQLSNLNKNSV